MESDRELDFEHYTVAWIAPLEIEAQAAWHMLDHEHQGTFSANRGDDYVYMAGDINGHNVVIATLPAGCNYGVGSGAALASQVKRNFPNLWFGLLVGVAAGLPNFSCVPPRDIRLGDVLVGVREGENAGIVSYGLGKGIDGLQRGAQPKTEAIVSSAIGIIKCLTPVHGNVFLRYYDSIKDKAHSSGTFADPGQERDRLYLTVNGENGSVTRIMERASRDPSDRTKVWYGPIGSGDKVVKSSQKRDELRDKFNLIGLEMEAAGVMIALPVGVIRGVCDYGDAQKNKEWQPYAAAMAAAYAKALLYKIRPAKDRREEALQAQKSLRSEEAPETHLGQCGHSLPTHSSRVAYRRALEGIYRALGRVERVDAIDDPIDLLSTWRICILILVFWSLYADTTAASKANTCFLVPFDRFICREDIITDIDHNLETERQAALAGIGGVE
ncbi:MAG: hypothetical protein M1840_008598 [Geoglossum simile]|nr:MAG: hypothetical protein M1840_008598 [Geoglossum simile]